MHSNEGQTLRPVSSSFLEAGVLTDQYPGLTAGFTTRHGGVSQSPFSSFNLGLHVADSDRDVVNNRHKLAEELGYPLSTWIVGEQVHETKIVKVSKQDAGLGTESLQSAIAGTDGLYTRDTGILLTSLYADCVPLFFIAPSYQTIGLAHAGWKGTVGQIGPRMISRWQSEEGIEAKDIHVLIGPSISGEAYEVNDVVIKAVDHCLSVEMKKPYIQKENGRFLLDLKQLNKSLLLQAGIHESNIYLSSICTFSDERMFSHRGDHGTTGRMMSVIGQR
ncbi:peptidoglycan editing factor PgeF [Alkalicoccobacillus murimartini]|uniref:Purine nucleoside phosphorylase n=1 Tax=Alkalicoccobacillus murimartini TaxID=171685 RepID=A0ABT9YF32_9BACI|nr:peptidoglycan editing factor PgeF [Alkalicoccobacillus murimartini]MDQ0206435.1 YfiH family protein [Alkalicoccobacillus murimartini]